jgi:hypothetical protein
MRSRGTTTMQLERLVPRGWGDPEKKRVRARYPRLSDRLARSAQFEPVAAHPAPGSPPRATSSSGSHWQQRRAAARSNAMSDQATFWFWIVALALTCLILGAVLASAALAQGVLAEPTVGDQRWPHRLPPVAIVVE